MHTNAVTVRPSDVERHLTEDDMDARDLMEAMREDDGVRYSMDDVMRIVMDEG